MVKLNMWKILGQTTSVVNYVNRCFHASSLVSGLPHSMSAWCIHDYGKTDQLTLVDNMKIPPVENPDDVLVKVYASSVNPIDVAMLGGYGKTAINTVKKLNCSRGSRWVSEFPLILGRDFSGTVVRPGQGNAAKWKTGDQVWGCASPFACSGTHAQFVSVSKDDIAKKPSTLSHSEAASMPYAALTVWSALTFSAGLHKRNAAGKKILILGGSGGAGTFAIQLLRTWNADITTSCSSDAADLLRPLGANVILDYASPTYKEDLKRMAGFDIILDCAKQSPDFYMKLLKKNGISKFVTLTGPILGNLDKYGFALGTGLTSVNLLTNLLKGYSEGAHFRWAYYMPNKRALDTITQLVDNHQIGPVVQRVVPFSNLPDAFNFVASGPKRGKTVIEVIAD